MVNYSVISSPAEREAVRIKQVSASAYKVPTDFPESDGTLEWNSTTLVLTEIQAGGITGIGYTYADNAVASLVNRFLAEIVRGEDAMSIPALWDKMLRQSRNLGKTSLVAMAISAVDCALWDLKARLLNVPLVSLLGAARTAVPVYGSGGFTSYSNEQLKHQLAGWVKQGISSVKMKVGRDPSADPERVRAARSAVGPSPGLFVDANGGYDRKQALALAEEFAESNVSWFEEPVIADDLEGLRLIRDRAPAGMDVAAGEYGYDLDYFCRMLQAGAVDVLQADITRCAGLTGFMKVAPLCEAFHIPISSHCAPAEHVPVACAVPGFKHIEYFHDHVRIEQMFFDGLPQLVKGELRPDLSRPGNGLEFKRADAARFSV